MAFLATLDLKDYTSFNTSGIIPGIFWTTRE
jgi:hypothetical protein